MTTESDDERVVREAWDVRTGMYKDAECAIYIVDGWKKFSWSDARAFTEQRRKQIAEVEEEIEWLGGMTALEVIDVRVQRVQEISKKDAKEEGIRYLPEAHSWSSDEEYQGLGRLMTPLSAFAELWDSISGKKHPWESNPWVWAITFRRIDLPA